MPAYRCLHCKGIVCNSDDELYESCKCERLKWLGALYIQPGTQYEPCPHPEAQ